MRLLSVDENHYDSLPVKSKVKRAKMFVKLITILEISYFHNLEKVRDFVEIRMIEDDFEYMTIEELIILRDHGFLDNSKIYELFPEEFDYLEGVPVLMWDQL
ncbi:hypothetical protein [Methanosarcina siciliae]|uniref:hypothetical protein n=1 Tax=Methanosarcina siciliae TaxID=38027 RepID=UPI00064F3863|nr:hypothetical protein [Methanosarcina siciliae]